MDSFLAGSVRHLPISRAEQTLKLRPVQARIVRRVIGKKSLFAPAAFTLSSLVTLFTIQTDAKL